MHFGRKVGVDSRCIVVLLLVLIGCTGFVSRTQAQDRQTVDLTFASAVDIALNNSYRVEQLNLGIERTRRWLKAERAGLKSRAYMRLTTPQIEAVSDHKWNSSLDRYEIVNENSRMWKMHTAIRQPVVLFGHPTNGYLSLNNTLYRYTQLSGSSNIQYYNRYFIKYEQPLFQPNTLKNNIEEAELDLEREGLEFKEDIIDMIDDIGEDYYELFELSYERKIYSNLVDHLIKAESLAEARVKSDTLQTMDLDQVQVELANARERLNQTKSNFRLEVSQMKQRLRLEEGDSIYVEPAVTITTVEVDLQEALKYGQTLRPRLRRLQIRKRQNELNLANAKGWNSFRVNLKATYGREMQNPRLGQLWEKPTNSYSVGIDVYIPIWDWGRHKARVQARRISLQKTKLRVDQMQEDIRSDIQNAIQNLKEYEERALAMEQNLKKAQQISQQSLTRYQRDEITISDLLQSFSRQQETADNFLDAYLGYRRALLSLQQETYYDFEQGLPVFERFKVDEAASLGEEQQVY